MIVFCEFFGKNSFAGQHIKEEPKDVVLFDINLHKKGFIGPREFLKFFGTLEIAECVYDGFFTEEFEKDVIMGKYPVFEGVIVKGGNGHNLWMRKIKTLAYKEKLKELFHNDWNKYW